MVNLQIDKPDHTKRAILHLRVLDPDSKTDGAMYVNNNGPLVLFGRVARSQYDKKTVEIQLPIPSAWWLNGANCVRFVHKRTNDFRVGDAYVEFEE